jgi:flagellar hook assembly protein FlgD
MKNKVCVFLFMLFGFTSISFAQRAYPNPWIPDNSDDKHGTLAGGINFDDLPSNSGKINVYNIAGELVRKLTWNSTTIVNWDGKNDKDEYVASGVYIWILNNDRNKIRKIVVIR